MRSFYLELQPVLRQRDCVLVSVIRASGSAPRGVGANMAVWTDGATGTIGGGSVEKAALELARDLLREQRSEIREYSLSPSQVSDLGMVCGGNITVALQYLAMGDAATEALLAHIAECIRHNRRCTLITRVEAGGCTHYLDAPNTPFPVPPELAGRNVPQPEMTEVDGVAHVLEPIVSGDRVLVFGAGHIGRELSELLAYLGLYHVMVDDRADFLGEAELPRADRRLCMDFGGAVQVLGPTDRDAVVILTRGHLHDYTVLRGALRTPARYIGMIGSRSKIKVTFDKLRGEGVSEEDIARVHAPIGIPLGGKTPPEIALAIAAQLVRSRNGYCERQ